MEKEIDINFKDQNFIQSLYNNLNHINDKQYLIILDYYHINGNYEESFETHLETLKEFAHVDNVLYLLFCKKNFSDDILIESTSNIKNKVIKENMLNLFSKSSNVYYEDKLSNIYFIVGYASGKQLTVYIFTDDLNNSSGWLKINDNILNNYIKWSELDYLKVTLNFLLKDKRRLYDQSNKLKNQSKLSLYLNGEENKIINNNTQRVSNNSINNKITNFKDVIESFNFQQIIENIRKYFINSPPNSFDVIKSIIINFTEQNANTFFKNYNINEEQLSFLIFTDLIEKDILINPLMKKLIRDKIIINFDEIEKMLCFCVNSNLNEDNEVDVIKNTKLNIKLKQKKNSKRIKKHNPKFSISPNAEEEYKNLIMNCPSLCDYVKGVIVKILSKIGITNIDRLPLNPGKYKNFILSYINNQELLKLSKKILNLDYDKIVNVLTEGIIVEFMRNNLIGFISDKKIFYNINEIEQEKFRLSQYNN